MFEHIHFIESRDLTDFTENESSEEYKKFLEENSGQRQAMEAEFLLQGDVRMLLEVPVPDAYRRRLLYIQSFSCMNMSESYFTCRKNYPSFLLLYTYEGKGELIYDGKTYVLTEGDGFLIDCKKEHTYRTIGRHWYHSDLHFYGGESVFLYQTYFAENTPVFHEPTAGLYQNCLEIVLKYYTQSSRNREFLVSAQLTQLLTIVMQLQTAPAKKDSVPENIVYLQKYLEHHFTQDISLDEMARFCGLSKYHMSRQFKKYTSFSPKEYILHLRISRAKMLLMSSDIPAYKIGLMIGMDSEANFIRLFKLHTGTTPGEYRRQIK